MKLSDFKGLFKKSTATIESIENPFGDYYQIKLKPAPGTEWTPGEHAFFKITDRKIEGKPARPFSVASTPEEGVFLIGTRTGKTISSFKKELISMKKGDKIAVTGPFGWFKIQDESSPMVLIAGGVGITPIRALVKKLEFNTSRPVEVIYASSDHYLFEEEIATIAANNKLVTLTKTATPEETDKALEKLVNKYQASAYYYISGSQSFIKSIKSKITNKGVKGKRIINDPFLGY